VKRNYSDNTFGGVQWENNLCQDFVNFKQSTFLRLKNKKDYQNQRKERI
jgi:hypothetical protein